MPVNKRHKRATLNLEPGNYERLNGDPEMMTRSNKETKVDISVTMFPDNQQKPTKFVVELYAYVEEMGGDHTTYRGTAPTEIPVAIAANETFVGFHTEGDIRTRAVFHAGEQMVKGQHHDWVTQPAGDFVESVKIKFDAPGADDDRAQHLEVIVDFHYDVDVQP